MKHFLATIILLASCSLGMLGCDHENATAITTLAEVENGNGNTNNPPTESKMKITVGSAVFTATCYDNSSVVALKSMMPFTIKMEDLNANEKFYNFSNALPTSASAGGDIQVGDLMLYGNNCPVLFYKAFNTSYSYTRLGKIDNVIFGT